MKFIDDSCECLCPILLSNGMRLELEYKGERMNCEVVVLPPDSPIGINSSVFLTDLVTIDVELVEDAFISPLSCLENLTSKRFNLNIFNSQLVIMFTY